MKKTSRKLQPDDDMRAEYDFRGGIRGKYASQFAERDAVVIVLAPDVAEAFPTSRAVHTALRKVMRTRAKPPGRVRKP
jgi:hypothetical protein